MTITAKVIAHSHGAVAPEIVTLQLRYPKFIHAEFMTHRVFSRNASSSRAIPTKRLIEDVITDPVYPSYWGKNQKGMQAREEHDAPVIMMAPDEEEHWDLTEDYHNLRMCHFNAREAWDEARSRAIAAARAFDRAGYHKQIVNRIIEPFSHINVVVTSTEWSNFFELRCHPDAQPEMRLLAEAIRTAIRNSEGQFLARAYHLPYVSDEERKQYSVDDCVRMSIARCARVSYLTQEGTTPTLTEDLNLCARLLASRPLHASPAEHQAMPDTYGGTHTWLNQHLHGNFTGWIQHRKVLEQQHSVAA